METIKEKDETLTYSAQEAFLEDQTTCCLCGTSLKFAHQVDYLTLRVHEEADCPSCMIQLRSREHTLQ